ncbi:MAG: amidase [Betaproteobacteria bacterium]|nr:amidase [Betaproteobacteria bacterium]MDE2209346.1 amidase [Betaproteobacteria bacterium]
MDATTTHLADCTAAELLHLYRTGQASPVEATQAVLERVADLDRTLNAFCLVDPDRALESARASQTRWAQNAPSDILDGVPVSIKDLILTRGWPTLRGSRTVDPRQAWDIDAPVTARLREAGAVLIGKTNTPEFGIKATTDSLLTGITRNPWNTRMTAGGSSGGAAAAVAAGMGPLAVGTDGAGSVRIPSSFCGIPGLKPSFGRVPMFPTPPSGTVAHVGPHARSVEDLALLLTVMSRPDARDWTSLPYDPRDYRVGLQDGVLGLRIAFSPDLGYVRDVDPEIAALVRKAAEAFAALGAQIDEVAPGFSNPEEITAKLWFVSSLSLISGMTQEQVALTDPALRWQAEQGRKVSALELQKLTMRRGELGSLMRQFHQRYDLLLTPAVSLPAFEAKAPDEWELSIERFLGWTPFSYPFNLTQQPAIAVPCGLTRSGLPVALQIVGPMHGDALVLRAARAYESTRSWKLPVTVARRH